MSEELSTAISILEKAMRVEVDGQGLYREAAERTTDPQGRRLFQDLAGDEQDHLRILQKEHDALIKTGKWVPLETAKRVDASVPSLTLFPREAGAVETIVSEGASDLDALRLAMDFERRGYRMYREAAETAETSARTVYEYLAGEESRHYILLERAHTYLESEGAWFFYDIERPHFDGG